MSAVVLNALSSSLDSDAEPGIDAAATADAAVASLTARMVAGEEAAWVEFHGQYFDRLLRYLFVLCRGDEQAARDALQATLAKAARHVRRCDREEAWWGWLTVVARSCVIDAARGRSRYRALLDRYAGWAGFFAPATAPTEKPLAEWLDDCLAALPPEDRALLVAKYHEEESTAELAARAGCSAKALESRLARLRRRVKEQLINRMRHED